MRAPAIPSNSSLQTCTHAVLGGGPGGTVGRVPVHERIATIPIAETAVAAANRRERAVGAPRPGKASLGMGGNNAVNDVCTLVLPAVKWCTLYGSREARHPLQ